MTELLATARFAHRALVVTCLVLSVVSVPSPTTRRLEKALSELQTVQTVAGSIDGVRLAALKQTAPVVDCNDVIEDRVGYLIDADELESTLVGLDWERCRIDGWQRYSLEESPGRSASLSTWLEYLERDPHVLARRPDSGALRRAAHEAEAGRCYVCRIRQVRLRMSDSVLTLHIVAQYIVPGVSIDTSYTIEVAAVDSTSTRDRLSTLIAQVGGEGANFDPAVDLRAIRTVLNEVGSSHLTDAEDALRERIYESRRAVSLLGMQLSYDIAIVLAPLILITILLYLLSHLQRLGEFVGSHADEMRRYPWVALYPQGLAFGGFALSVVVLPLVAVILLTTRGTQVVGVWWVVGNAIVTMGVVTVLTRSVVLEAAMINRAVRGLPADRKAIRGRDLDAVFRPVRLIRE